MNYIKINKKKYEIKNISIKDEIVITQYNDKDIFYLYNGKIEIEINLLQNFNFVKLIYNSKEINIILEAI